MKFGINYHQVQQQLIEKNIKFFVIDANEVAEKQECEVELIPLCKRVFQTFRSFTRGRSHQTNQKKIEKRTSKRTSCCR